MIIDVFVWGSVHVVVIKWIYGNYYRFTRFLRGKTFYLTKDDVKRKWFTASYLEVHLFSSHKLQISTCFTSKLITLITKVWIRRKNWKPLEFEIEKRNHFSQCSQQHTSIFSNFILTCLGHNADKFWIPTNIYNVNHNVKSGYYNFVLAQKLVSPRKIGLGLTL